MTNICIFLESGRTFTFKDVSEITDNESTLAFSYYAMSDGLRKRVTFSKFRIVGSTIWHPPEEVLNYYKPAEPIAPTDPPQPIGPSAVSDFWAKTVKKLEKPTKPTKPAPKKARRR